MTAAFNNITLLFDSNAYLQDYLKENRAMILSELDFEVNTFSIIDLDALPTTPVDFKEVLLRWLIAVNKPRIDNGENPIVTFDLIKLCPIWKIVPLKVRKIPLNRSSINKAKPITPTRTKMSSIKGFNSKQKRK